MENIKNCGVHSMKNRELMLEHKNMLYYSKELIQLCIPYEINFLYYTMLCLVCSGMVFMSTVRINDVKKVSGIIRTQENNSTVKNVISGKIKEIRYMPNQYVEKGEVLYSLDEGIFTTVMEDLLNEKDDSEQKILCMNMLLDGFNTGKNPVDKTNNLMIFTRMEEYFSTVAYLEKQINICEYRKQKEINQPDALFNLHSLEEAEMNLALSKSELEKYKSVFAADVVQQKTSYELEYEKIKQNIARTQEQYSFLKIKAPVSGFVQEISSLNEGDYVFENQSVINIIPDDNKSFKVELSVPSRDIGEILPEMDVKYRLSAFPFFEYKGANGKILSVDSDVRQAGDGRLYYQIYADIDRISFQSKRNIEYPLKAGIEVDARIVLDKLSILHFILGKLDFMQ